MTGSLTAKDFLSVKRRPEASRKIKTVSNILRVRFTGTACDAISVKDFIIYVQSQSRS